MDELVGAAFAVAVTAADTTAADSRGIQIDVDNAEPGPEDEPEDEEEEVDELDIDNEI